MPTEEQGLLDFQLYLLKTMDPPDHLLAAALERVGRTRDEMRDRYEVISKMMKPITGFAGNLRPLLAEAVVDKTYQAGVEKLTYSLPLWRKFNFGILFTHSGQFIKQAAFERKLSNPGHVGSVVAWDFLRADLLDRFVNLDEVDVWGHYETFLADDPYNGRRYFLRFGWGLLQEVEPLTGV